MFIFSLSSSIVSIRPKDHIDTQHTCLEYRYALPSVSIPFSNVTVFRIDTFTQRIDNVSIRLGTQILFETFPKLGSIRFYRIDGGIDSHTHIDMSHPPYRYVYPSLPHLSRIVETYRWTYGVSIRLKHTYRYDFKTYRYGAQIFLEFPQQPLMQTHANSS